MTGSARRNRTPTAAFWSAPPDPLAARIVAKLRKHGLLPADLAARLGVPAARVYEILTGKAPLSAQMALRLAKFFGEKPETWALLGSRIEIEKARSKIEAALDAIVPIAKTGDPGED